MLFAVLGDVHGNVRACQAALERINHLGIQTILNTGDMVGAWEGASETVALIEQEDILSVQGAWDRRVAWFSRKKDAWRRKMKPETWTLLEKNYGALHSSQVEFLRRLPRRKTITMEGISISLSHGMPVNTARSLEENQEDAVFRRQWEEMRTAIIITGKTHRPFYRWVDTTLFVNPGSLGIPGEDGMGTFALVDTESTPWQVRFETVTIPFPGDREICNDDEI